MGMVDGGGLVELVSLAGRDGGLGFEPLDEVVIGIEDGGYEDGCFGGGVVIASPGTDADLRFFG